MAAHVKTGTEEILRMAEEGTLTPDYVRPAVELSCFTEDHWALWNVLNDYANHKTTTPILAGNLRQLMHEIKEEWEGLGQPCTREEWHRRKYGSA